MTKAKTSLDLCRMFWRSGDFRIDQVLSAKQTNWLKSVLSEEGLGPSGGRACYVGDRNEFMVGRHFSSNLYWIKPTDEWTA